MTNSKLNPASEAISMVKAAQTNEEDIPVTPLRTLEKADLYMMVP